VPMTGSPGKLQPMHYGPVVSNQVQLSPNYGVLSAYFNRGILATQATARALTDGDAGASMLSELKSHIEKPGDPLRADLAGQMIEALTSLPHQAVQSGADLYCALYEFEDPEVIGHLAALKRSLNLILSNMPGTDNRGQKTKDTYSAQRQEIKDAGAHVIDRFMPSSHIGHNKFQILVKDEPQAVLFGSTNVTSNALCAQTNNSIIARSAKVAAAYKEYWDRLKADTKPPGDGGKAQQSADLRNANSKGRVTIDLEDSSGTVDVWFSPNTPKARGKAHGTGEAMPPDLAEVFELIGQAQQAVVFLVFQPGAPSIVDAVAVALQAKPSLFVRGAVTMLARQANSDTAINGGGTPVKRKKGDPPVPEDYRVIHTQGIGKNDAFGQWEAELNQAGHAVIHDKIVVIDPFSDNCAVVAGSHNLGYQASYNNDENLAIIRGHRAIAEAYAAHCLDVYDHYAWRYWLENERDKAWHFLAANDSWQDAYFDRNNQVKSAELGFWLAATPAAEALPAPDIAASTRARPALQRASGGITPAVGPDAAKPLSHRGKHAGS